MLEADRVVTVSNLTRNIVITRYGINPDKVVTVHNAVDFQSYSEMEVERGVKEKVVTFLGRITYQKGPEYFIEAANKVLKRYPNVRFVMAGSGDMMNRSIRRVAKLKIATKFHFTGFLRGQDVQKMFAHSDVYVMPSVSEPFGIALADAIYALLAYPALAEFAAKYGLNEVNTLKWENAAYLLKTIYEELKR